MGNSKYEIVKKYSHAPEAETLEGLDYFDTYHEAENFLKKYCHNGKYMTDAFGRHRYYIREITEAAMDALDSHWANVRFASYILD